MINAGTAHCADIYSESRMDPPQLKMARRKISDFIGNILPIGSKKYHESSSENEYSSTIPSINTFQSVSSISVPQIMSFSSFPSFWF